MNKERFNYLMTTLENFGDLTIEHFNDDEIGVTFEDFWGFDEDWNEITRDYEEPELVAELEQFFEENLEGDFYLEGELFGNQYCVGYSSFDI